MKIKCVKCNEDFQNNDKTSNRICGDCSTSKANSFRHYMKNKDYLDSINKLKHYYQNPISQFKEIGIPENFMDSVTNV